MMIPKTIVVCGRPYNIVKAHIQDGTLGETDSSSRTISLEPGLDAQRAYEILVHELIHATLYETGVANVLDDKQNEAVADAVALAFSDIFTFK